MALDYEAAASLLADLFAEADLATVRLFVLYLLY